MGTSMNLKQVNKLWQEYKKKYSVKSDAMISEVRYDMEGYVEGCFNIAELLKGEYILHLNPNMHGYSEGYVQFILFHEFTHFRDFIQSPLEEKIPMIMWMNAYSEYHATRIALSDSLDKLTFRLFNVDKIQLPGPYREISVRRLLSENAYRAKICFDAFFIGFQLQDFANGFRQLMYLFGYFSLFENDELMVRQTLKMLRIDDHNFFNLYQALKDKDYKKIVELYKAITDEATLVYLKAMIRHFYPPDVVSDEEINHITMENFQEYIDIFDERMRQRGLTPPSELEDDEQEVMDPEAALIRLYLGLL